VTASRPGKLGSAGFSLVELVLVLFLTGIILLVVSRLCQRTFATLRTLQEKSQTIQAATLGLERLGSELREAIGAVATGMWVVTFSKVDPGAPYVLDNDRDAGENPGPPDPTVAVEDFAFDYASDANGDNQIGTVEYKLDGELLKRTASKDGQSMTTEVATHVNAFIVEAHPHLEGHATADNVFLITLTLKEQRRVYTFTSVVTAPGVLP
jgi:type II secretory pathway pseudopilin PulG